MNKLLKEAIADAKIVRESALANAKLALQEQFAPALKSMLSAKLNEEEDDEMKDDETTDENFTFETKDADADDAETTDEAKKAEAGEEEEEEEGDVDLDELLAELDAESEVSEAKGDEEYKEDETTDEAKKAEDSEEEIDLDELLAELEGGDDEEKVKYEAKGEEDDEEKVAELTQELNETRKVVSYLKSKLNEVNLLNSKLLYSTKLFKNFELNENQKIKILESLDRTKTVREVKLVYTALTESFKSKAGKSKITESLGLASKVSGKTGNGTGNGKAIINESTEMAQRFQKLANIIK